MHPAAALLLLVLPPLPTALAAGGWDMADRFIGLRYECASAQGAPAARAFALAARDLADELSAFGWAQVARNGSAVVGEFRGTHTTAPVFEGLLRQGLPAPAGAAPAPAPAPCVTRHYPSTLIKLHFADFKILEDARETCFDNAPHQCAAPAEEL